ncbi:MAG: GT4 family glycosyltransferase PelF [bacterium]
MPMKRDDQKINVCLYLEGTYPYVAGGVSGWVHELIQEQAHLTFYITAILPPDASLEYRYELPPNVLGIQNIILHRLRKGHRLSTREQKKLFQRLETPLLNLQSRARTRDLQKVMNLLSETRQPLGRDILMNSNEAWVMMLRMYNTTMGNNSFLDYFWSWRALLGGLYSMLMAEIPEADCYHALCTGFAGLLLAKTRLETQKPCLLTEHGIYTNERRIEIGAADWLQDPRSLNLSVDRNRFEKNLRDLWIETFAGYSKLCYEACEQIFTLYEGNKVLQLEDGAAPEKLFIIPNGIDFERYSQVIRDTDHPPTVALIGRVVPIKDIKTYIRAVGILHRSVKNLRAWIMGPMEEDPDYYQECLEMVEYDKLQDVVQFTGKVKIDEYLGRIDVIVLTSLSEAQPLVLLEAGAAGIPSVATEVGSCREIIEGRSDEAPALGAGGVVCSLSSPAEVAQALERLLVDHAFYQSCSLAMKERVRKYYNKTDQHQAYRDVYAQYVS